MNSEAHSWQWFTTSPMSSGEPERLAAVLNNTTDSLTALRKVAVSPRAPSVCWIAVCGVHTAADVRTLIGNALPEAPDVYPVFVHEVPADVLPTPLPPSSPSGTPPSVVLRPPGYRGAGR